MPRRTGPTDPNIIQLINQLKKKSAETNASIWKTVAEKIEKPRRKRATINISKINRYSKENDIIIVPGSVLSSGKLDHSVIIAALKTTEQAKEKIRATNSKFLTIHELLESNHEVGKMKILV